MHACVRVWSDIRVFYSAMSRWRGKGGVKGGWIRIYGVLLGRRNVMNGMVSNNMQDD